MSALFDQVTKIITDACHPTKPDLSDPDKPLLMCGLDSLDYASTLLALEETFDVSFETDDMDRLHTVNAIVDYIERRSA